MIQSSFAKDECGLFIVLRGYVIITGTKTDCHNSREVTLKDIDKIHWYQTTTRHNKVPTIYINRETYSCPRPTVANFVCEPIRIGIRCASHSTVLIRITSYYFAATFVLVRRPIRMFWNVQKNRIGPANRSLFVLRRIASPNVVSIRVNSYWFVVHSYRFVVDSHWDSPPVCSDSVRCNTMRNERIVVLDRTCSHWFV